MSATDVVEAGLPLPRLREALPLEPYRLRVVWSEGPRAGREEEVDLLPVIQSYRYFRPLRGAPQSFARLRLEDDGATLVWEDDELELAASTVERLAEEGMDAAAFTAFLERNRLTYDAAAAVLGISRRQVAYYAAGEKPVPRLVALACRGYEAQKPAA